MTARILQQIYNALLANEAVTSRKDFSEKLGRNYTALSSAMNGKEAFLTEGLARCIRRTFPQVNPEFIRTGEGYPIINGSSSDVRFSSANECTLLRLLSIESERNQSLQQQIQSLTKEKSELIQLLYGRPDSSQQSPNHEIAA
jgi:hypothetical protein